MRASGGHGRMHDRNRHATGWDGRFALLILFPFACVIVVTYEFVFLQQTAPSAASDVQRSNILRHDEEPIATFPHEGGVVVEKPDRLQANNDLSEKEGVAYTVDEKDQRLDQQEDAHQQNLENAEQQEASVASDHIKGRKTMVLIANYRDTKRCAETLQSIFDNAVEPDLVTISIYDQIYEEEGERPCVEDYCDLVGEPCTRRPQIISDQINALNATGPTEARYRTQEAITDEDFCLTIDSHIVFVPNWDDRMMSQWEATGNDKAILTVYPKSVKLLEESKMTDASQLMCISRIETKDADAMIQYGAPTWIKKAEMNGPRLMSQFAGGFNFATCEAVKEVRDDPYTPYLFHGEEYSRAARLWTSGYDFYTPSDDLVFHWYEPRKVMWERDWSARYKRQQLSKRRIRYNLGLPVTKEDFDRTDLEKFTLGNKRTMAQWKEFSGIDPLATFISSEAEQFNNCKKLEYVPYE